jgi:hypothetical protein
MFEFKNNFIHHLTKFKQKNIYLRNNYIVWLLDIHSISDEYFILSDTIIFGRCLKLTNTETLSRSYGDFAAIIVEGNAFRRKQSLD